MNKYWKATTDQIPALRIVASPSSSLLLLSSPTKEKTNIITIIMTL